MFFRKILYKDPFDEDFKSMVKMVKEESALESQEKVNLTCSYVPGTTIRPVKVSIPKLGFRVYDTPGLISPLQSFNLMTKTEMIKYIDFTKELKPLRFTLKSGNTMWIGGLIRIDLRSVC
jgi:hypothetical protein